MKKILMMLLGVAFATCAWADSSWACFKEYSAADKEPADAHAAWYSCCYLSPSAIKTATAGQVTSVDCDGYSAWLQAAYADNKAATIANASLTVHPISVEYFMGQYYLEHKWVEPTESTEFLAICFFEHGKDQAFKVIQMDDVVYICDDNQCEADTGWIAVSVGPQDPIEYLTWDADTKEMVATNTTSYTVVTKDTATFEDKKWYVVKDTIERGLITVNGDAHLILCDGASLKVTGGENKAGIEVPEGKRLAIYGQSTGDLVGQLIANGAVRSAGIGGKRKGTCGTITINGGKIKATGGMNGAGIGGGNHCSTAATITINGGNVEAIGGSEAAGIGSGNYHQYNGSRSGTDVITINGGTITATGGKWGAGIGSGSDGLAATVTINGGTITASTQEADAIGSGDAAKAATTVTFAEGVEFSIEAGAEEASATATTVDDYTANHSARYVKIVQGLFPTVTLDEIIEGEDWTKFDVAYTLENLEEGVDYKVLIEVTAGGKTKSITNGTDIVIGSFTNSVDTVQLFGGKVFDEKAKVKVSLGTWKELKWTQLWEKGPYFAEYNVGAKKPEEAGKTYTFAEAQKALTAPMRVPTKDDIDFLSISSATKVDVNWDNAKKCAIITGRGEYASNSIFLPAAVDYWTSTAYSTGEKAYYFGVRKNEGEITGCDYYVTSGSVPPTYKHLVRAVVDPKNVDSVKYIFDPVSTAEETVELLAPPVEYLNWDGAKFVTATNRTYYVVTAETKTFENGKWYVVDSEDVKCGSITVKGSANLILVDDKKLTVNSGLAGVPGVEVTGGKSFTVYGQAKGTGTLEATGSTSAAGIGGGSIGTCGKITINGGTIKSTGDGSGAGIGGSSGSVIVNGGAIEAMGGKKGAAIVGNLTFGTALASKYVWAGASSTACEGMTTAAFATSHSAAYVELPVDCYTVTYDANGAAGVMTNSIFAVGKQVALKANSYGILGYTFDGWTTNGVEEVVYADKATGTDFVAKNETLELTAKWTVSTDPIVPKDYDDITNMFTKVVYPVTITLKEDIVLASGDKIVVPEKVALAADGGQFDISAIIPAFGTPTVVGEGFAISEGVTEETILALFKTEGVSKLVFDEGTISIVARGETEEYPWVLDAAATNVTAWVEDSNLVIGNGLPEAAHEVDLVALTNSVAKYGYAPASPLNAKVKVVEDGETSYKTPTLWIGASGSYATLEAALAAGETSVLPGYGVTYSANGATGTMTNGGLAAGKDVTLDANAFVAVGYTFAGWTTNGTDVVYGDGQTGKNFASVDGTLALTAKWELDETKSTAEDFSSFTNMLATAQNQSASLAVTIGFSSDVKIPAGETVTLPSGGGFNGLKYVGDEEGGSNLELEDGVLYGSAMRGEVTVDALALMKLANGDVVPTAFKAITEGETTVTNDVVMLLGDDGVAYDTMEDVLAANPRPTTVKLFEVTCYWVSYDANGAVGTMETDMFIPTVPTNLTANAFTAVGNAFAGWTTNGTDVAFADGAAGVDFTTPGETLALTALWTKVETNPTTFAEMTNLFAQATLPVTFTLTNDVTLADGDKIVLPAGKDISFAGEGQFDVSSIVPAFGTPVVVGEGFADDSALALFDTKGVSKLVFEEGTVSLVARGETEDFPWNLDAEANVTAWVDPSLTNLAAVVIANGPAADAAIDLTSLTNNLEVYGYTPEVTPLNALVKVVEAGETAYLIPTGWIGAEGTYATLEAALAAGETTVVPNFATEAIPAVIAEYGTGADGIVYTAVVANDPGDVTNAIQAVAAEGLLALATNELANVRLVVAAEAAADVAAEEAKIMTAITNDIPAVADLVVDYVDLSVFFDDVPQTTLTEAIGIRIPWTLNPQRDYAVARVHASAAEKLPVGAANAVDGEYVEFATDGLVIHTKKFSLYAIGEITPFTTVMVPTGVEGFTYVVSNLTTGVEMTFDSTVDGGVTYKLPVGSKVSITCVPEEGYVIDGETTYVIESVTKETTLAEVTLPVAREDDLLYPTGDGDTFVAAAKSTETFNGTIFGEDGVEGVITLKMTKPNKRTNLFNVQATVKTLVDKASYSFQAKKVAVPEAGVLTVELVDKSKASLEHKLVVVLDGDSLTGAFDDWAIDGARDVFGIKNHPKRTALAPLVGTWTGLLAGEGEQTIAATFSVKIAKTARATVKVTAADGKVMSCSSKVEIGADGRGVVPVTVSRLSGGVRTSLGFRILFRQTAEGIVAKAVNVTPVRRWSKKTGLTTVSALAFVGAGKLTVTSKQFRTDYVLKLAPTYAEVLGDPASESLKLDTYGRITGTIKWKVPYLDVHGHVRVKSVSGKVTGIVVGDAGFGTVAVKLPTGEKVTIDLELQKE